MIDAYPTVSEFGLHKTELFNVTVSVTLDKTIRVRAIDKEEALQLATNRTLNKTKAYTRSGHDIFSVEAEIADK
jgi:hypothetical protein